MGKLLLTIVCLLALYVGTSEAQVVSGTVFSKVEDGVGNKITSTVFGGHRGLDVICIGGTCTGAAGGTYLDADGIADQTASAVHGQNYMYNGVTWDRVRGTIASGLEVNCITGCAGGSSTPSDAFANPVTAGLQMGFSMGYNGATWDRLRSTIAGGLLVDVSDAFLLDATVTNRFPVAANPADNETNAANISRIGNYNFIFDGAAWDRWTGAVTQGGTWNINNISGTITLPTGAATEATLGTLLLNSTFTGRFPVAYVDADTIANQTTTAIHGQLYGYNGATWDRLRSTIAGGLLVDVSDAFLLDATFTARINTLGQKAMAASTPVVIASDQASIPVAATVTNSFLLDATFTGRFAAAYVDADTIANQTTTAVHGQLYGYNGATWDRLRSTIAGGLLVDVSDAFLLDSTFTTRINTLGQKVMASSTPVVISNDQSALPVSSINSNVSVIGTKSNNVVVPGAVINLGVLQCVANAAAPTWTETFQVTCSVNLLGATRTIEQNFVATSNSDGSCPSGAASFTVIASNASRTWLAVWASPANTDDVYIKLAATATTADARFAPGQALNFTSGRIYTGIIDAIPASGTQAVCVMELN